MLRYLVTATHEPTVAPTVEGSEMHSMVPADDDMISPEDDIDEEEEESEEEEEVDPEDEVDLEMDYEESTGRNGFLEKVGDWINGFLQ